MKNKSLLILFASFVLILIVASILYTLSNRDKDCFSEPTVIVIGDFYLTNGVQIHLHPDSYEINKTTLFLVKGTPLFIPDRRNNPTCYESKLVIYDSVEGETVCIMEFDYKGKIFQGYIPEQYFSQYPDN